MVNQQAPKTTSKAPIADDRRILQCLRRIIAAVPSSFPVQPKSLQVLCINSTNQRSTDDGKWETTNNAMHGGTEPSNCDSKGRAIVNAVGVPSHPSHILCTENFDRGSQIGDSSGEASVHKCAKEVGTVNTTMPRSYTNYIQ